MGEYRCEGIGSVLGGNYDNLHVEGVFTAKGPIAARNITSEGVSNFSALRTTSLTCDGVTNIRGLLEAEDASVEGVLNAEDISVAGNFYADGVVNTDTLKAGTATLLYNNKANAPRFVAKVYAFFTGKDIAVEKEAKIKELEADTLVIEDYYVENLIGTDVTIGQGCIVDKVQAGGRLRIHKTATVKDILGTSVVPEYFA